jgi:hypothetical protein
MGPMKRGRVPEDLSGVGRRSCLRLLRLLIADVTLAVDAEVTAIGRLDDPDGRKTS